MRLRPFLQVLFFVLIMLLTAGNSFAVTWTTESLISSGDYRDEAVGDLNNDGHSDMVAAKNGGISIKHQSKSWIYGANGLIGDWQYSFGAYAGASYPNRNFRGADNTPFTADDNYIPDSADTSVNTGNGVISWPNSIPPKSTKTEVWEVRCTAGGVDTATFTVQAYDPNTGITRNPVDAVSGNNTFTLGVTNEITGGSTIMYSYRFYEVTTGVSFIISSLETTNTNYKRFAAGDTFTFYTIAGEVTLTSTGTNVYNSVKLADINKDGNLDIVAVSDTGVDVWFGDGRGGWTRKLTNALTSGKGIKVGDFNRDGNVDIAIATTTGIKVYTGDGTGLLAGWTAYSTNLPVAGTYNALFVGDYNNDGIQDIIAAKADRVEVYKNNGDGTWTLASTIGILDLATYPNQVYRTVALADLDSDGKLDIAAGLSAGPGQPAGIVVYYGNGAGLWTASSNNPTGFDNYYGITIADLNNDGSLDIAGAQDGGGVQVWFGNKSTRTWIPQTSPTVVGSYKAIQLFTDTTNGVRDLIAAKNGGVDVFRQASSSLFNNWRTAPTAGGSYQRVAVADIDKDGHLDIVATDNAVGSSAGGVHVFYGDGVRRIFAQTVKYPAASDPATSGTYYGLALGDMNRDGYTDIVATSNGQPGGIKIWNYVPATHNWTAGATTGLPSTGNYYGVKVVDLNGDGYLDIIAGSDTGVKVYIWNNWTSQFDDKSPSNTGAYFDIVVADVNRDGKYDIAAAKSGGISIWLGDGTGDFSAATEITMTDYSGIVGGTCWIGTPSGSYAGIAIGDIDGDGNLDIVAGNNGGCGVQAWFGDGSGKTWRIGFATEPGPNISNIGNGGIGFGYPSNGAVHSSLWPIETGRAWSVTKDWTLTGNYDGTKTPPFAFTVTDQATRAAVGNPYNSVTREILNLTVVPGSLTFHPTSTTDTTPTDKFFFRTSAPGVAFSGNYYTIDLADVNHDGNLDLVAASNGGGVSIWFGNGRGGWTAQVSPATAGDYNGVALADFNGDGYLDVIAAHNISGGIGLEVFLNAIDLTPPTITSTTPANNATNIAVSDSVTVAFSEAMDRTTINSTNITVTGSGTHVIDNGTSTGLTATVLTDASKSWIPDAYKGMTLNPDTTQGAKTYTITGNTSNTITVTGNMTGDGFVSGKSYQINSSLLTSDLFYDGTLTIDPTLDFFPKEQITVKLTTGVTDSFGNGLDGNGNGYADGSPTDDYTFTFQTKDTAPTGLQATVSYNPDGSPYVQLNWDSNRENNFKGYFVYRSTSSGGCSNYIATLTDSPPVCQKLASSPQTAINYTDTTVINDTAYYYVVIALDEVPGYPTDVYPGSGNGNYVSGAGNEATVTPTVSKPTVTNIDPGSGATGIAKNKAIDITFSRDMAMGTLAASQFSVVGSSKGVYTITTTQSDNKTVRLSHAVNFDSLETVTVTVKSGTNGGLKDISASPVGLASDYVITITSQYINIAKTIMVSATPNTIPGDGTTSLSVIAVVQDNNGYPVPAGATVTFTTGSGKFPNNTQTITATTNASGQATTSILAPAALQTNVTLTGSTVSDLYGTVTGSAIINFKPGPPLSITLSASPAAIPADNVSTSLITADVKDSGGNYVKDGLYVTFTATVGTFTDNGTTTSNPVATSGGKATISIKSSTTGTPTITAVIGGVTSGAQTPVVFTAKPSTITVAAVPSTIAADGVATSTITATVKDSGGTNIPNGVVINFSTTSGTLSASSAAIAGGAGQASVNLTSTASNGTGTVTASWIDNSVTPAVTKSGTVTVTFSSGLPATVTVTSDKSKMAADNTQLATISALVKDSAGKPVNNGTVVNFTITSGVGTLSGATTTAGGIATVNLKSGTPGSVTVTATPATGTGSGTATVTFVEPPTQVAVSSSATSIAADGTSTATITATISDQYGYPVSDGLTVGFSIRVGGGTLSAATGTISGGKASVTITATTTLTNIVTVRATCEGVWNDTTIAFKPGPPATIEISSSPSTISANGADTSTITATIKDTGGNPVKDGLYVTLTTTRGTFPNKTKVSDPIATAGGMVTVVLTADINKLADGTATITAVIGSLSASYAGLTLTRDNIPPTVLSVSPANGNAGVLVNTTIAAVFSEAIDQTTLKGTTFTVAGSLSGALTGAISYSSATKTATFVPSTNFKDLEIVTVTLTTGVTDLAGNSLASNRVSTFTTRDSVPPAKPTGLSALAGNAKATLSWTANTESDIKGYYVYRSDISGSGYVKITTGGYITGTNYVDSTAANSKTYYYEISAIDTSDNESSNSSEVSATPNNFAPPAPPVGLKATAGDTKVTLGWTSNTETDLSGYNVYRSVTSGGGYVKVNTSLLAKTATGYTDSGLTNGTVYYYVITAINSGTFEGPYSSQVSAAPKKPNDPGDVNGDGKVDGTDLVSLGAAFGSQSSDVKWNLDADLDKSGRVDGGDMAIFGKYFGKGVTW